MSTCSSCWQFELSNSYALRALLKSRRYRGLSYSCFQPKTNWRRGSPTDLVSRPRISIGGASRASMVESSESSSEFVKRTEQAWLIAQQPRPVACLTCKSNGNVECKWCRGTGFFILGDNILCEVPSRNTTCVICAGKGFTRCTDCKGTGFRAKWLGQASPGQSHEPGQT